MRAITLLYKATQRFSMEFYIRPFLNRWPEETLTDLALWAPESNCHIRRLVSEWMRPKLGWARAVRLTPEQTLPLLDRLQADPTRYVTRSVANHLNDQAKSVPEMVLERLKGWAAQGGQDPKEHAWMRRHALRSLIKQGHPGVMAALGFRAEAPMDVILEIETPQVAIGDALSFNCRITSPDVVPVLVDYRIGFARPAGQRAQKVIKLEQAQVAAGKPLLLRKVHKLKANATTFTLHSGLHEITLQVNGMDRAQASFEVI